MSSALWCVTNGRAARAAGDRLHHRRLDLEEAARVEERGGSPRRSRARVRKMRARVRVDDQVDVALAVARSRRPARPCHFSGSGRSALARQRSVVALDRQLAGLACGTSRPVDADDVAEVELAKAREGLVAELVAPHVHLEPAARGPGGARTPPCRSRGSPSDGRRSTTSTGVASSASPAVVLQRVGIVAGGVARTKVVRIRRAAEPHELGELLPPDQTCSCSTSTTLVCGDSAGKTSEVSCGRALRVPHRHAGATGATPGTGNFYGVLRSKNATSGVITWLWTGSSSAVTASTWA